MRRVPRQIPRAPFFRTDKNTFHPPLGLFDRVVKVVD